MYVLTTGKAVYGNTSSHLESDARSDRDEERRNLFILQLTKLNHTQTKLTGDTSLD